MDRASAYLELGLAPGASFDSIRMAYRNLAKDHHPSSHSPCKGSPERWKNIQDAADLLSVKPQVGAENPDWNQAANAEPETIFEKCSTSPGWQAGKNQSIVLEVGLELLLRGGKTTVPGTGGKCRFCSGQGFEQATASLECPTCGGSGRSTVSKGIIRLRVDCPTCGGSGKSLRYTCASCDGSGQDESMSELEIIVPASSPQGTVIRLVGKANPGFGGAPAGDLIITLQAAPHPRFKPYGQADLSITLWVSFSDLCLGATATLEAAEGSRVVQVRFGPLSPAGTIVRVPYEGMPRSDAAGRGSLCVRLMPHVPGMITPEQKLLLEKWRTLES